MPDVYDLLPSVKYFDTVKDPVVIFDPSVASSTPALIKYGAQIDSADKLSQFLLGTLDKRIKPTVSDTATPNVLNSNLLSQAISDHNNWDNWQFPATTQVIQIAGWGVATTKSAKYSSESVGCDPASKGFCVGKYRLRMDPDPVSDGDGVVVSPSAVGMASSSQTWYVNITNYNNDHRSLFLGIDHKNILEINSISDFIKNAIVGSSTVPQYFSTVKPTPPAGEQNLQLNGVHSPVVIDAYDSFGNHTGLVANSSTTSDLQKYEENIPGSRYFGYGEDKYIVLPDGNYQTKITGAGFGTFTYEQKQIDAVTGNGTTTLSFNDVPVTPNTIAQLVTSTSTGSTTLQVDINGDGQNIVTIKANQSFDPVLYLQMMKEVIDGFNLKPKVEKDLDKRIDDMIKTIQKGKIKNADRKVKQLIQQVKRKHYRPHQIPASDKDILVNMLNNLLDNLK
jgi:hypothetical protein